MPAQRKIFRIEETMRAGLEPHGPGGTDVPHIQPT